MPKQVEKKSRIIQGTKIPVARDSNSLFKQISLEATGNMASKKKFTSTPISSKDNGQPIRFRKLEFSIAKQQTKTYYSNININFNFGSSINSGFFKPAVEKSVVPMAPYVFSGSDQLGISTTEKTSNHPLARPHLTKSSSNVHQGSDVESITKSLSDIRLERHKQMFKSRYAKKNHCEKGDVVGIRLNRRFDLLMKYREDQLAANRGKM